MSAEQRQTLLSAFLIVLLFCVVVAAMPPSSLERRLWQPAEPVLRVTGLDQSWGVFAPNPRRVVDDMWVRVEYADGHSTTWRPPKGYRWRKLMENVVENQGLSSLWRNVALYAAHAAGGHPRRAVLVRRSAPILPGAGRGLGEWRVSRHAYPVRGGSG